MPISIVTSRRALLAGSAAGLAASALPADAQSVKGVTEKEITVGTMAALTGPLAANGISMHAGTSSVFNLANERGGIQGRKLRLISEDNAYSAPQALAAVRKMASSDGIFALLDPHATPQIAAVLSYMDQQKTPIFGGFGGLVEWYNPPRKGLFGLYPFGEDQGRALGRWAAKDGRKKVLVLHIEGNVYQRSGAAVEKGFRDGSGDGSVELQGVKFGTSDYAPVAIKIAQTKPDAVALFISEFETVLFAKELKNQGISVPIYAWVPIVTQNLINTGGASVEGIKATSMAVSPLDDTPPVKEYRDALAKYFPSEKPEFFSFFAFAVAKAFVEGLSRMKGAFTHDEFYRALYTMKDYETGILTPITFSPERHQGTMGLFRAEITNGKWKMGEVMDAA